MYPLDLDGDRVCIKLKRDGSCELLPLTAAGQLPLPKHFDAHHEFLKSYAGVLPGTGEQTKMLVYLVRDHCEFPAPGNEGLNPWTNGTGDAFLFTKNESGHGDGFPIPPELIDEVAVGIVDVKHRVLNPLAGCVMGAINRGTAAMVQQAEPRPSFEAYKAYEKDMDKCLKAFAHPHCETVTTRGSLTHSYNPRVCPRSKEAVQAVLNAMQGVLQKAWPTDATTGVPNIALVPRVIEPHAFDDPNTTQAEEAVRMARQLKGEA